jgi:hypothetical protein
VLSFILVRHGRAGCNELGPVVALLGQLRLMAAGALLCIACGSADPPGAIESAHEHPLEAAPASATRDFFAEPATAKSQQESTCRKIDFLFVIDNSLSMERQQVNLARSFPGFMAVIARELRAEDFHVMVTDTDAMGPGEAVAAETHAPSTADEICDVTLGAGRRSSHGGGDCQLASGARFIDAAQSDLSAAFGCIGHVGTAGSSYEQPVGALLGATSEKLAAPGACNAAFLRDDAVLVVTIVTDEDDTVTAGQPEAWRDELLRVKHDDDSALVLLGLVGDENRPEALDGGPCPSQDGGGAPRLQSFVESFPFGSLGAVCASNYAPFFERAVGVIGNACRQFVPPVIR